MAPKRPPRVGRPSPEMCGGPLEQFDVEAGSRLAGDGEARALRALPEPLCSRRRRTEIPGGDLVLRGESFAPRASGCDSGDASCVGTSVEGCGGARVPFLYMARCVLTAAFAVFPA